MLHDTATLDASCREWDLPATTDEQDARYLQSVVAWRIADVLARVAIGDRLRHLGLDDREWLMAQGEQVVQDAVARYDVLLMELKSHHGDDDA